MTAAQPQNELSSYPERAAEELHDMPFASQGRALQRESDRLRQVYDEPPGWGDESR